MDIEAFMQYVKYEFPGVIDSHWNWDLLENILNYAVSLHKGNDLITFLTTIIPEVTHEEYMCYVY